MKRWGVWMIGAVVTAQLAVPAFVLFGGLPPQRFGFQMFGGYEQESEIVVRDSDGVSVPFDEVDLWPASLRPELDWTKHVPYHACQHVAGAHDIVVSQHASGQVVVPCP